MVQLQSCEVYFLTVDFPLTLIKSDSQIRIEDEPLLVIIWLVFFLYLILLWWEILCAMWVWDSIYLFCILNWFHSFPVVNSFSTAKILNFTYLIFIESHYSTQTITKKEKCIWMFGRQAKWMTMAVVLIFLHFLPYHPLLTSVPKTHRETNKSLFERTL